jgi:hypothetical protein
MVAGSDRESSKTKILGRITYGLEVHFFPKVCALRPKSSGVTCSTWLHVKQRKEEHLMRTTVAERERLLDGPAQLGSPDRIMQLGFAFRASKALLCAVEFDLVTELADAPLDAEALERRLGLHARGARDFLDVLVARPATSS